MVGSPRLLIESLLSAGLLLVVSLPFAGRAQVQHTAAARSRIDLKAEHQQILDELNRKNADGKVMDLDDDRVAPLVRRGWKLAGAWAAGYIETHSTASARELERIFADFAPKPRGIKSRYGNFLEYSEYSLTGTAVRIAPSVYVVEARYGVDFGTGAFMVVARGPDGHFAALWNIKDLAERHYPQRDEIGRWMHLVRRAYYNGALNVAKIVPLPHAANGHARFLVDAYQAADGGTALAQLSIWEWDGALANPLLVESYEYARDFDTFQFDGRTLRISTKEQLETLISCGMCREPQGVWTVRITPAGVENLGHRFLQPELQWADELLSRINDGSDVTHLIDGKALDTLKARIREGQEEARNLTPQSDAEFSWGMLDRCHVLRRGRRGGSFVLLVDEGQLQFTYELREGRPYFTDVEIK